MAIHEPDLLAGIQHRRLCGLGDGDGHKLRDKGTDGTITCKEKKREEGREKGGEAPMT